MFLPLYSKKKQALTEEFMPFTVLYVTMILHWAPALGSFRAHNLGERSAHAAAYISGGRHSTAQSFPKHHRIEGRRVELHGHK